jgi:hypothetical protein
MLLCIGASCAVTGSEGERADGTPGFLDTDFEFIAPQKTTRAEVLQQLGEPDEARASGRELIYRWERVVFSIYPQVTPRYELQVRFDAHNRVEEVRHVLPPSELRFVIDPKPGTPAPPQPCWRGLRPTRFSVQPLVLPGRDVRGQQLLGYAGSLPSPMQRVFSRVPMGVTLADYIREQIEAAGHHSLDRGGELKLTGQIIECEVSAEIGAWRWTCFATLEIRIEAQANHIGTIVRRYGSTQRTHAPPLKLQPDAAVYEAVVSDCLADIQRQIAADRELATAFGGGDR